MSRILKDDKPSASNKSIPLALIFEEDIHLLDSLGEGAYGDVKRGKWIKSEKEKIDVAVKILRNVSNSVRKEVEAEIQIMSKLQHPNLVVLYGVVLGDPMFMVMEFCDGGSLFNRLRSSAKPLLLVPQLLNYALQIASGMKYLQEKGYIHRDLATRNVLLKSEDEIVKLCDFGLSRVLSENDQIYDMQGKYGIPFSWCPPEALRFRKFSSASDVWAFGVTLWECFTYGEEPWIGLNLIRVLEVTDRGERLRKPDKCSPELYNLMLKCWALEPINRPDFQKIYEILIEIKFAIFVAIKDHIPSSPFDMPINKGEKVVVIKETAFNTIYGQNMTSRKFGRCPKTVLDTSTSNVPSPPPRRTQFKVSDTAPLPVSVVGTLTNDGTKDKLNNILIRGKVKQILSTLDTNPKKSDEKTTISKTPTGGVFVMPQPPSRKESSNSNLSNKKFVAPLERIKHTSSSTISVSPVRPAKGIFSKWADAAKLHFPTVANLYVDNESVSVVTHHGINEEEAEREFIKVGNNRENFDKEVTKNEFWKVIGLSSITLTIAALTGLACGAPFGICITAAVITCIMTFVSLLSLE